MYRVSARGDRERGSVARNIGAAVNPWRKRRKRRMYKWRCTIDRAFKRALDHDIKRNGPIRYDDAGHARVVALFNNIVERFIYE